MGDGPGAARVPADVMGVIHDNPTSAQAIEAARESVCVKARNLNMSNGESLRNVALMAEPVDAGAVRAKVRYELRYLFGEVDDGE